MKKFLLSLLVIALLVNCADAQSSRRKKPKKPKGNHSNDKHGQDFTSINSVMYSSRANEDVTSSTLVTPQGWGSAETFGFVTASGTPDQAYSYEARQKSDFGVQMGFGAGDSRKLVSVVGILNVNDVSAFQNYSASFIVSRKLGKNSSISAGGLHLFADADLTDAGESFFVAYSQMLTKKLTYTIGAGTGKFLDNTETDIKNDKMAHGTALFGSLSYQATKNVGVSAEWTGVNLALSSSVRIKRGWPVLSFGVNDITRLSSDKPTFLIGIGQALVFNKGR